VLEGIKEQPSQLISPSVHPATVTDAKDDRLDGMSSTISKGIQLTTPTELPIAEPSSVDMGNTEEVLLLYDENDTTMESDRNAGVLESNICLMFRELQDSSHTHLSSLNELNCADDLDGSVEQKRNIPGLGETDLLIMDEVPSGGPSPLRPSSESESRQKAALDEDDIDEELIFRSSPIIKAKPSRSLSGNSQEDSDDSDAKTVKITNASNQAPLALEERKLAPSVFLGEEQEDTISLERSSGSQQTGLSTSVDSEVENTSSTSAPIFNAHPYGTDPHANLYGQNSTFHPHPFNPHLVPSMQMVMNSSSDVSSSTSMQQRIYTLEVERQRHMHEAARCEQEIARCYEMQRQRHLEAAAAYQTNITRLHGGISAQQQLMWTNMNSYLQPMSFPRFP